MKEPSRIPLLRRNRIKPTLVALLISASFCTAGNQPEILTTSGASGFELYNATSLAGPSIISWFGPGVCDGEFPRVASVRSIGGGLGPEQNPAPSTVISNACDILDGSGGSAVRDNTYVYYFAGRILRKKALGAGPSDPHTTVPLPITIPILSATQRSSVLTISGGTIYWGSASSTGNLTIYQANPATGTASSVRTIFGANSEIRKIEKFSFGPIIGSSGGIAVLLNNGDLYRINLDTNDVLRVATSVTDFAIHPIRALGLFSTTYIFASKGSPSFFPGRNPPPGSVVRIVASSGAATTIYTASGDSQVQSIAVDPGTSTSGSGHNLYISQAPVDCSGLFCVLGNHIIRRSTTASLGAASVNFTTILNDDAGTQLASDGNFLYYLLNGGIRRICSDADPVNFNMAALNVEITQATQTLGHTAVVVSGKKGTTVRAYATVTADNTGAGPYFPFATLEASVNGTPLPGSPFYHINNAQVSNEGSMANLRPMRDLSFLFELPPLPPGNLTVRFCVNPNQNPAETDNLNNNDFTRSVTVQPGVKMCLVTIPMRTGIGAYNPNSWTFPPILERAEGLLPISQLEVRCWQPLTDDHSDILTGDPFFPGGTDDDDENYDSECLDAVECVRDCSDYPSGCPVANWHGLIKFDIQKFGGLGNRPGCCAISEMQYNPGRYDLPRGGRTIAHELAHNYGRQHVDCGGPKNPDLNYPYNPCTIGTGSAGGNFGYDPLSRTVILPGDQGDLLSYDSARWVSDYTWNALYSSIFASSLLPATKPPTPRKGLNDLILFATGSVDLDLRTAKFGRCWVRPEGEWPADNVQAAFAESEELTKDEEAVRVELLSGDRNLLRSTPVPLPEPSDPAPLRFTHFVPFEAEARFVRVVHKDDVLAEKLISIHAPTVDLAPPVVDAGLGVVQLQWQASDSDGDPLSFMIQHSPDEGANWFTYRIGYRGLSLSFPIADLPGGERSLFRVVASDGILTDSDTSGPLDIPSKPPVASISGVQEGERVPFGSPRRLLGMGLDPEDGTEGVGLTWGGTIPPTTGRTVPLGKLPPGIHQAILTARDTDGMTADATRNFEILPPVIPEASSTPLVDGMCADAAYAEALLITIEPRNSEPRSVRLLHRGTSLYLAFTNIAYASGRLTPPAVAEIRFDLNGNGVPDNADIGFSIDQNGDPVILTGNGTTMGPDNTPPYGAQMAILRGDTAWCAEMRIPDSLLGGWDKTVPIMLSARGAQWPAGASGNDPETWATTGLRSELPPQPNRAPVADAGPDDSLTIANDFIYALNGDGSFDPDGDSLTYSWTQVLGPTAILTDPTSPNPAFAIAPPTDFTLYRFRLVVNDGTTDSVPDVVQLVVYGSETQAPSLVDAFGFSDEGFHGRFAGLQPDALYNLNRSRNLMDWTTIGNITADAFGNLNFFDLIEPGIPSCFYQAVRSPGR